jgi:hypothetical protein
MRPRSIGGIAVHPGSAARAAATARSTSAGPASATSAMRSPDDGSTVANVSPSTDASTSPAITWPRGAISAIAPPARVSRHADLAASSPFLRPRAGVAGRRRM